MKLIQYCFVQRGNTSPALLLLPVLDATKDCALEEKEIHNIAYKFLWAQL